MAGACCTWGTAASDSAAVALLLLLLLHALWGRKAPAAPADITTPAPAVGASGGSGAAAAGGLMDGSLHTAAGFAGCDLLGSGCAMTGGGCSAGTLEGGSGSTACRGAACGAAGSGSGSAATGPTEGLMAPCSAGLTVTLTTSPDGEGKTRAGGRSAWCEAIGGVQPSAATKCRRGHGVQQA